MATTGFWHVSDTRGGAKASATGIVRVPPRESEWHLPALPKTGSKVSGQLSMCWVPDPTRSSRFCTSTAIGGRCLGEGHPLREGNRRGASARDTHSAGATVVVRSWWVSPTESSWCGAGGCPQPSLPNRVTEPQPSPRLDNARGEGEQPVGEDGVAGGGSDLRDVAAPSSFEFVVPGSGVGRRQRAHRVTLLEFVVDR